jgi:dTDP-4-dehydrorhamnose 3,5-epimerase
MLKGARRDRQTVTAGGAILRTLPGGVEVHEVRNVVTRNGLTTEVYRSDWSPGQAAVAQVLYVTLRPGAVSAWHCHLAQLDRIFCVAGSVKLALYDDREGSATRGQVSELHLDRARPTLVTVPPGMWHGLKNLGAGDCAFLNFFDRLYDHADPDEWRLAADTDEIPYRF